MSFEVWLEKLNECIKLHALQEGGIKAILCSGRAPRGLSARSKETSLTLIAFQYIRNSQPLSLLSVPWLRDAKNPIYQLKSINYLEAIIARRHAEAAGVDDALFLIFSTMRLKQLLLTFLL